MIRILLAEDDDAMRTYLARALTNAGYDVVSVDRGTAAEYPDALKELQIINGQLAAPLLRDGRVFGALARVGQAFVTYVLEDPTAPYSSTQLAATAGALQHAVPPSKHSKLIAQ